MMIRRAIWAPLAALVLMAGCSKKTGEDPGTTVAPTDGPTAPADAQAPPPGSDAERPTLTRAECEAQGGVIVGDIGDGAIHRPDYTCESGQPPIGTIKAAEGEPIATEGEVCCPA